MDFSLLSSPVSLSLIETASTRTHISLAYACVLCLLPPLAGLSCSSCNPGRSIIIILLPSLPLSHAASPLPFLVTTVSIMASPPPSALLTSYHESLLYSTWLDLAVRAPT
ncbi:unnamed protein product [Urochloa humidicola]